MSKLWTRLLIAALTLATALYSPLATAQSKRAQCQDQSIVLGFTGDILVHDALYKSILDKQTFKPLWRNVIPLFNKADFMVVNLEGPAAFGIDKEQKDRGNVGFNYDLNVYSGTKFVFNFHPQILTDLKESGIDLVSNANNHSLDRGSIGIDRTLEAAAAADVGIVGIRHSTDRAGEMYHVANVQGFRLAFIACTEMTNKFSDKKRQLLYCYQDASTIENLIRDLSSKAEIDGVIVMPHWGVEYSGKPTTEQREYAQRFLNSGALAIVGSHPHVLQPVEHTTTSDGRKAVVAYSLGNFLAFQKDTDKKTGAVFYLRLGKNNQGRAQLLSTYYSPTYRESYQVLPAGKNFPEARAHAELFFTSDKRIEAEQNICD